MSPICPKAPHPQIYTKFGAAVEVAAVLAYTTFLMLGHGMFILWGGEKCHLPLTKPVAVNTGLALPRSPWKRQTMRFCARMCPLRALKVKLHIYQNFLKPSEKLPLFQYENL